MDEELRTEFDLGDGLVLRAWSEDDIDAAFEIVIRNLSHLRRFMIWATDDYSVESARKFLTDGIMNRNARKNLGLGIFRDDRLIGSIGFGDFDWNARKVEIGYWIDRDEEGKGVISRACRKLIEYAFEDLHLNRIEIRCSTQNSRSAAVPERLGFKREAELRQSEIINGQLHDFYTYGLLAEDKRVW